MTVDELIKKLSRELPKLPEEVAKRAAPKLEAAIGRHWDAGQDPEGNQWAPLKNGSPSYLNKRGAMRASLNVKPEGTSLKASADHPSLFHQYGTYKMEQRKIFPSEGEELPKAYQEAIQEALDEALEEILKE